jgi:hypothetical protein
LERRHRQTVSYWFFVVCCAAFWVFGATIATFMLSMSLRGRINGGVTLNAFVTLYGMVWIGMVTAFAIALWHARDLPRTVQFMALARAPRPGEPIAVKVWWWTRAAWFGWLAIVCALLLLAAVAFLFDPWR